MNNKNYDTDWDKYHRKNPIKEINLYETMYNLVKEESKKDMDLNAMGFFGNNITYKELFKKSDMLAKAFYANGVREGDTVAILTISMPIVEECLLSLSKIGATMAWIDLRTKGKDLVKYINNSNCKTAVIFEDVLPLVENIIDETDINKIISVSPKDYLSPLVKIMATLKEKSENKKILFPNDKRFVKYQEFLREGTKINNLNAVKFEKDRPSLIIQSSGSTGKAKQILHTEYNFNSVVQKLLYTDLPLYKGHTMHISVPPFIIYGLANSIYTTMVSTMKAEMNPLVDESTVYNDLGKFDISFAAPIHYKYIYDKLEKLETDIDLLLKDNSFSSKKELKEKYKELKRVMNGIKRANVFVSGGDKFASEDLIKMQQKFDKTIVNGYGNNEVMGASIVSPVYANRPGSIGIPMKDVIVKVVNPETQEILQPREIGELYISTDGMFVEYLNNIEETNKIKIKDESGKEWVKTGDLCYIDEDGYIYPKGRNRRLIKKEAFKISPDTIEDVITSLPFVKDCVVVGVNDEKSISVPMAYIVLNEGIIFEDVLEEIKQKCIEDLPDYEVPTYFEYIETIPYTPNNKQDFKLLENLGNKKVKEQNIKKLLKK